VSAITTLTTPWLIRWSGPAAAWVDAKLPRALQTFLALEGAWTEELRGPRKRAGRVRRLAGLLLLDAALLAEVYLAMTRGQDSLAIELDRPRQPAETLEARGDRPQLIVIRPSAEELDEHVRLLADMEAENNRVPCVWRRFEAPVELR